MIDFKTPNKEFIRLSDTSTGYSCGTGWVGPKPGDPSSPALLLATPVYGAVEVSWQYPTKNPGAVSHTKVFRNTTDDFSKATLLSIAQGNLYRDIDYNNVKGIRYYWIVVVSIHGTESEVIGPASAEPLSSVEGILDELSGKINNGHLAQELQKDIEEIPKIEWLNSRLNQEIIDREFGHLTLISNISSLTDNFEDVSASVVSEQGVRATADAALARAITQVSVDLDQNMASAVSILEAGVKKNEDGIITVARRIDEVKVETDEAMAQGFSSLSTMIQEETDERKTSVNAVSEKVDAVQIAMGEDLATAVNSLETSISKETSDRIESINALATSTQIAQAALENDLATSKSVLEGQITKETNDRKTEVAAVSRKVDTTQTRLEGNIASVETSMNTKINTTNGKVNAIGALYTAKVSVNGLVGGFGVYNDGRFVEAGFDVDTFWIGRNTLIKKPFVVKGSNVYMSSAFIEDASIYNAKIANLAVNEFKIADLAVTTGKIKDLSVETLKIAGNAVTIQGQRDHPGGTNVSAGGHINSNVLTLTAPHSGALIIFVHVSGVTVADRHTPRVGLYLNGTPLNASIRPAVLATDTQSYTYMEVRAILPAGNHTIVVRQDKYPFGGAFFSLATKLATFLSMR